MSSIELSPATELLDVKPAGETDAEEQTVAPASADEAVSAQLTMPADLPKEILLDILRRATESLAYTTRYRNLKRAALVAKAWREPSQSLICRDVVLHTTRACELWLEVCLGER